MKLNLLLSLLAVSLAGCSNDIVGCTRIEMFGIHVDVRDSTTSARYSGPVTVRARNGAYVDNVMLASTQSFRDSAIVSLVPERAGSFRVEVDAPGYLPWRRDGVKVTSNECM